MKRRPTTARKKVNKSKNELGSFKTYLSGIQIHKRIKTTKLDFILVSKTVFSPMKSPTSTQFRNRNNKHMDVSEKTQISHSSLCYRVFQIQREERISF